jgi:hypothetical protein
MVSVSPTPASDIDSGGLASFTDRASSWFRGLFKAPPVAAAAVVVSPVVRRRGDDQFNERYAPVTFGSLRSDSDAIDDSAVAHEEVVAELRAAVVDAEQSVVVAKAELEATIAAGVQFTRNPGMVHRFLECAATGQWSSLWAPELRKAAPLWAPDPRKAAPPAHIYLDGIRCADGANFYVVNDTPGVAVQTSNQLNGYDVTEKTNLLLRAADHPRGVTLEAYRVLWEAMFTMASVVMSDSPSANPAPDDLADAYLTDAFTKLCPESPAEPSRYMRQLARRVWRAEPAMREVFFPYIAQLLHLINSLRSQERTMRPHAKRVVRPSTFATFGDK